MQKTKKIALYGLMLAVMATLTAAEHTLPPLPLLPPGVKLGLANIVTMYCAFFVSRASAAALNALKALFVLLTRGAVAGLLSFCGGMLSVGVVLLLLVIFKNGASYTAVSVSGAIAHNLGQYAAASALLGSLNLFAFYLPVLFVSGAVMGLVTAALLRASLPALRRLR